MKKKKERTTQTFNIKSIITKLSLFIFLGIFFFSLKTFATEYKSIVFDFSDNWGWHSYMGLREIDFYKNGKKIEMRPSTDYETMATTTFNSNYKPQNAFDTSLSLIGTYAHDSWISHSGINTKQRLIFTTKRDFDFDEIVFNNNHYEGNMKTTDAQMGVKNTKIYLSKKGITDTTYQSKIGDMEEIFSGILPQHPNANTEQNYKIPITKSGTITMKDNPDNSSNSGSSESGDSSSGETIINNNTGTNKTKIKLKLIEGAITIGSIGNINLGIFKISSTSQSISGTFTDNFWVEDLKGADKGRYTTLQATDMVHQGNNSITIPASNISMKTNSTTLTTIAGSENTRVTLNSAWNNYRSVSSATTFIDRKNGINYGILGKYGIKPSIQITIPAYQAIGEYQSILTYTLIER